jgi:hypothetical protein
MSSDYIPGKDSDFLAFAKNYVSVLSIHKTGWNIPDEIVAILTAAMTAFEASYTKSQSPTASSLDVGQKNDDKAVLKMLIRDCTNSYIRYNKSLDDNARRELGVTVPSTSRTPAPAPTTYPLADVDRSGVRQLRVRYWDSKTGKRAKPDGVHGVEIRFGILDKPPTNVDDLTNSTFDTASPYVFVFDEDQRGKMLYFCLRWENGTARKGPWGEIYSAIIP